MGAYCTKCLDDDRERRKRGKKLSADATSKRKRKGSGRKGGKPLDSSGPSGSDRTLSSEGSKGTGGTSRKVAPSSFSNAQARKSSSITTNPLRRGTTTQPNAGRPVLSKRLARRATQEFGSHVVGTSANPPMSDIDDNSSTATPKSQRLDARMPPSLELGRSRESVVGPGEGLESTSSLAPAAHSSSEVLNTTLGPHEIR